ncbi:hypothetical protein [Enterococcus villorum]|uniref:hypothetical protein n=1 Tax=Enterococcus villorum TaxID=112904 RepID=UPI0011776D9F|nr:hypothetical protein [Enterococcus villorum]
MKFKWLKDYRELDEQIFYLKWSLNKSELELARWIEGDLSTLCLKDNGRVPSLKEKIQNTRQEINLLDEQKKEMLAILETFKGIDNQIVKMKYIDGMKLEDIAEKIDYTVSYVRQRHAGIRKTLKFLDEYEQREKLPFLPS